MSESIGDRRGRWIVVGTPPSTPGNKRRLLLRCDCGTERLVRIDNKSLSCGCAMTDTMRRKGKYGGLSKHHLFPTYSHMIDRCRNKKSKFYKDYGGRGIIVCEEWANDFSSFLSWAEPLWSPGLTIDRIDNDGNYSPENCKFSTKKEQSRNTRRSKRYEYLGRRMPIVEISELTGVKVSLLYDRLSSGWTVERAVQP